jgi:hypothetical protein
MTETNSESDRPEREPRASWLDLEPADFDTQLPMTQSALFPEPDRLGTPPLFGGMFGDEEL